MVGLPFRTAIKKKVETDWNRYSSYMWVNFLRGLWILSMWCFQDFVELMYEGIFNCKSDHMSKKKSPFRWSSREFRQPLMSKPVAFITCSFFWSFLFTLVFCTVGHVLPNNQQLQPPNSPSRPLLRLKLPLKLLLPKLYRARTIRRGMFMMLWRIFRVPVSGKIMETLRLEFFFTNLGKTTKFEEKKIENAKKLPNLILEFGWKPWFWQSDDQSLVGFFC